MHDHSSSFSFNTLCTVTLLSALQPSAETVPKEWGDLRVPLEAPDLLNACEDALWGIPRCFSGFSKLTFFETSDPSGDSGNPAAVKDSPKKEKTVNDRHAFDPTAVLTLLLDVLLNSTKLCLTPPGFLGER